MKTGSLYRGKMTKFKGQNSIDGDIIHALNTTDKHAAEIEDRKFSQITFLYYIYLAGISFSTRQFTDSL